MTYSTYIYNRNVMLNNVTQIPLSTLKMLRNLIVFNWYLYFVSAWLDCLDIGRSGQTGHWTGTDGNGLGEHAAGKNHSGQSRSRSRVLIIHIMNIMNHIVNVVNTITFTNIVHACQERY